MRKLVRSFIERQTGLSGAPLLRLQRIMAIAGLMSGLNITTYSIACSLFVNRVGASGLALSYVVIGCVASPLYVWFAKICNKQGKPQLARRVLAISALVFVALWSCLRLDSLVIYYTIYVFAYFQWTLQLDVVLPSLISNYYTSRDYNRFTPWIVMAQALGGTIGGSAVSILASRAGAPVLLLAAVPLAAILSWRVTILERHEQPIEDSGVPVATVTQSAGTSRGAGILAETGDLGRRKVLFRYPIVRLLAASTFLWVILSGQTHTRREIIRSRVKARKRQE